MGKVIDNQDVPTDTQALTFDSSSDEWKAEDGGGGGANNFIIGLNSFDIVADNTIEFIAVQGFTTFATAENQRTWFVPMAFTVKNMVIQVNSNINTDVTIFTFRVEAADTALTISVPALTSGLFTVTEDVAVAKDDRIALEVDNTPNNESLRFASHSYQCEVT